MNESDQNIDRPMSQGGSDWKVGKGTDFILSSISARLQQYESNTANGLSGSGGKKEVCTVVAGGRNGTTSESTGGDCILKLSRNVVHWGFGRSGLGMTSSICCSSEIEDVFWRLLSLPIWVTGAPSVPCNSWSWSGSCFGSEVVQGTWSYIMIINIL